MGYSPCGHKESDTTELLTHTQMTEHNVGTTQPVHKATVCEKWNFQIPKGSENGPGGLAGSQVTKWHHMELCWGLFTETTGRPFQNLKQERALAQGKICR